MIIDPHTVEPNVTTRDGCPVMLFAYMSGQQRSYLGIFHNREAWIACSWNKDGTYINKTCPTGMDIIIIKSLIKEPEAA